MYFSIKTFLFTFCIFCIYIITRIYVFVNEINKRENKKAKFLWLHYYRRAFPFFAALFCILRISLGFRKCSRLRASARVPDLETSLLKRFSASSIVSLSRTTVLGIQIPPFNT